MKKMKCIIVDDEALAREGIEQLAREMEILEVTGSFRNAMGAQNALQQHSIDLMFLDINMPRISGLSFLEALSDPPITILTTAYPDFALEGFRLDVMDYLLKPISPERFLKAVNKAHDYFLLRQQGPSAGAPAPDYLFLKQNQLYEKVKLEDIFLVEAMQNYAIVHTKAKKIIVHITFKGVEDALPPDQFMRVHKSFLVNLDYIQSIEGNSLRVLNREIPIGRTQRAKLMEKVVNRSLLSKDGRKE